uniref:Importin-7/11-like TPR repeats domain-containing protein n=1 Tax=Eptatretus burgeri TaxID=7764 RepID=A0A8C4QTR3_EPTBU
CNTYCILCRYQIHLSDAITQYFGGECLRAFVSVAVEQVAAWHDDQGRGGLWYVLGVVDRLLDPRSSEFAAAFAGRLVSGLIARLGSQLGDSLDLMLRAVLSKMQQAETLSVMQSLIMVFAHLVHSQMDAVLEFLCNLPGPTGKPALEFVMIEWTGRQHMFYGQYEGKVSAIALCKLLQHGVATHDLRLQDITVRGDQVFSPSEGIRTRSKAARGQVPERWTVIPLPIKIYKLLVNELSVIMESSASRRASAGIDFGPLYSATDMNFTFFLFYDELYDEEEEDPDAVKDPLYQVDIQVYLTEFLQHFARLPCYSAFRQHLNDGEKRVLQSVGITS